MSNLLFAHQLLRGSGVSGTIDPTYQLSWLVDGNPGTPIQRTGNLSLAVSPPGSVTVDLFALVNHTVDVNFGITGGATATILPGTLEENGIRLNPFVRISPVTTSSAFNIAAISNGGPIIIGEFWGGLAQDLGTDFLQNKNYDPGEPFPWEGEFPSIVPYEEGLSEPRRLQGDLILTDAQFALLMAWYRTTRRGTRPSLIIPDSDVNDAWLANFNYNARRSERHFFVTLEIVEIQRSSW